MPKTYYVTFSVSAHEDQIEDGRSEQEAVEAWCYAVEDQGTNLVRVIQSSIRTVHNAVTKGERSG